MPDRTPNFGTIKAACKIIGGDKPVHAATFYRGVRAGLYPAPVRVAPNTVRVDLDKLASTLRALADEQAA
jgi:hypothetical protein